ncbi:MAG: UMP kinase [Thaumarchaeota archaeon]|nr:MAG: UMP kinase [Nitrososphaerota archaeon]
MKGVEGLNIVVKIGGHLISTRDGINVDLFKRYSRLFSEIYDGGRWCIVVGGGEEARRYVKAARSLGVNESICDLIAVKVTRINALLLASLLGERAIQKIPESLEELIQYSSRGKIVVMGGLQPGQSTIAVSALAAEAINADKLIVATDVDGIYTDDPKLNPDARLLEEVTLSQLMKIVEKTSHKAGEYKLIDMVAYKVLSRSHIQTIYLNGMDPENVRRAIMGERVGTLIRRE